MDSLYSSQGDRHYLEAGSNNLEQSSPLARHPGNKPLSVICYLYFFLTGCIGMVIGIALKGTTFLIDPAGRLLHKLTSVWALHYMLTPPGWRLKLEGRGNIPAGRACVIVSNHQSSLDPFFLYSLPLVFKWTAKAWVFKVPVAGWLLSLNQHLKLNDKTHPGIFLQQCAHWLHDGVSVLFFPEGTRSSDGELLPFKYGAFYLSARENVPILPVVICGSRDILPKGTWALALRANVHIRILPPVYPVDHNFDDKKLREHVRNLMQDELHRMKGTIEDPYLAA